MASLLSPPPALVGAARPSNRSAAPNPVRYLPRPPSFAALANSVPPAHRGEPPGASDLRAAFPERAKSCPAGRALHLPARKGAKVNEPTATRPLPARPSAAAVCLFFFLGGIASSFHWRRELRSDVAEGKRARKWGRRGTPLIWESQPCPLQGRLAPLPPLSKPWQRSQNSRGIPKSRLLPTPGLRFSDAGQGLPITGISVLDKCPPRSCLESLRCPWAPSAAEGGRE